VRAALAERTTTLAESLGLAARWEAATDPFFAPTARGQALLQQLKGLKRELVVRLPDGRDLAIASVNDHETYFGERFGIRLPDGGVASTSCVAFGLERWLLALLCTHDTDAAARDATAPRTPRLLQEVP
jgi:hypothetical protein